MAEVAIGGPINTRLIMCKLPWESTIPNPPGTMYLEAYEPGFKLGKSWERLVVERTTVTPTETTFKILNYPAFGPGKNYWLRCTYEHQTVEGTQILMAEIHGPHDGPFWIGAKPVEPLPEASLVLGVLFAFLGLYLFKKLAPR